MSERGDEVVRVAKGELVQIELYQQALTEEGIESKVVGLSLEASFGSTLSNSVELYVREADLSRAEEVLKDLEARRTHETPEETPEETP